MSVDAILGGGGLVFGDAAGASSERAARRGDGSFELLLGEAEELWTGSLPVSTSANASEWTVVEAAGERAAPGASGLRGEDARLVAPGREGKTHSIGDAVATFVALSHLQPTIEPRAPKEPPPTSALPVELEPSREAGPDGWIPRREEVELAAAGGQTPRRVEIEMARARGGGGPSIGDGAMFAALAQRQRAVVEHGLEAAPPTAASCGDQAPRAGIAVGPSSETEGAADAPALTPAVAGGEHAAPDRVAGFHLAPSWGPPADADETEHRRDERARKGASDIDGAGVPRPGDGFRAVDPVTIAHLLHDLTRHTVGSLGGGAGPGGEGLREEDAGLPARGRRGGGRSIGDAAATFTALVQRHRAMAVRALEEGAPPTAESAVEPSAVSPAAPEEASASPAAVSALGGVVRAGGHRVAGFPVAPAWAPPESVTGTERRDGARDAEGAVALRSDDAVAVSAPEPRAPDPLAVAQLVHDAAPARSAARESAPVERAAPAEPTKPTDGADEAGTVDGRLTGERAEIRVGSGEDAVSVRVSTVGHRVRVEASAATTELARSLVEHRAELDRALGDAGLSLASFASSAEGDRRRPPRRDPPSEKSDADAPAPRPAAPTTLERSAHAHRRFA